MSVMPRFTLFAMLFMLSACASMQKEFDPPGVTVESFRALPGSETAPRFEIGLRVTNPNAQALEIVGISYSIELLGKELINGVTNEIPKIEPYGEAPVTVQASLKLLQLLRLFAGLGMEPTESLDYRFSAKIDFAGFIPTQRVEQTGVIDLSGGTR